MSDVCFSCFLPDCDERHPRCMVRQLQRQYDAKRRQGQLDTATDAERQAPALVHSFWCLERKAEASEGGRAFRRGTTVYAPESRP